jgi:hypothetical protein
MWNKLHLVMISEDDEVPRTRAATTEHAPPSPVESKPVASKPVASKPVASKPVAVEAPESVDGDSLKDEDD